MSLDILYEILKKISKNKPIKINKIMLKTVVDGKFWVLEMWRRAMSRQFKGRMAHTIETSEKKAAGFRITGPEGGQLSPKPCN